LTELSHWLIEIGLEKYLAFFAEAEIVFADLAELSDDDLKELGLPLGPRRRAMKAIRQLESAHDSSSIESAFSVAPATSIEPVSDAERRHLTVMFVDLVGSTEMASRIDVEDMREIINTYQNTVAGIIGRFGFVAKFMGDGVLCYFGWPRANEDDAGRAVRAGLSIIDTIKTTTAPDGTPLATRIGIATGVVIVGDMIGSGATQEAAVVGETPNLAARLQGVAEPNQIVLPKETKRLLGNTYMLRSIGDQELKGISGAVEAFVVEGEAVIESRFAAQQSGTLMRIIGRDREIELMLERWALARSGKGQLLIVSGEAGIGKSRITRALIDEIERDDHVRITYQCSPYHADSTLYPIIQQMSFAAGIVQTDTPNLRLDKIEVLLGANNDALKFVAPMMGLDAEGRYETLDLTPEQLRAQTMQALTGLLVEQAKDKPLLLVYEDLHWIDPTSLELLELLLGAIADQKIMVLAMARPTFEYGFGGHPIVTRFVLNRLGKDQVGAIVSKLTNGKALPNEIMEIIVSRTDGVPLFVEELTKTILESGALKEDGDHFVLDGPLSSIAIPATLHDSLMARLDRLQPIKEVAQTAACIGREFSHGLLAQISHLSEAKLVTALDGLIDAELIYRRGLLPEATYIFKHALVRDAAYESLLKEKRRAIHAMILSALEADPDIAPELLAVHAEAANLTDRAINLWEAASKAALARPAFDEAISHLGRSITLITPKLEKQDTSSFDRALSLQVPLGMALLTRRGFGADETVAAFRQALDLADKVGETPMRYSILYGLWVSTGIRGQHADALKTAEALVDLASKSSDTSSVVVANRVAGASHWFMGNFAAADRHLKIAISHLDPVAHAGLAYRYGQDIGVTVHIYEACNLLLLGQTTTALRHIAEAERIAKTTAHIQTICYALVMRSVFSMLNNDMLDVQQCMSELKPIAQEHNLTLWLAYDAFTRKMLAAANGDKASIERYKAADRFIVSINCKFFLSQWRIGTGRSALAMEFKNEAAELANMAQNHIEETGETYALADLHRLRAELAKADSETGAAEKELNTALKVARKQGAKLWELKAAIDLAKLLQEQGRIDEAISLLGPVYESINDGDCPDDRELAQELLADMAR
jgi:class 3 adenylate cyclase/tetratricopeptide (TPR) repeat protein